MYNIFARNYIHMYFNFYTQTDTLMRVILHWGLCAILCLSHDEQFKQIIDLKLMSQGLETCAINRAMFYYYELTSLLLVYK